MAKLTMTIEGESLADLGAKMLAAGALFAKTPEDAKSPPAKAPLKAKPAPVEDEEEDEDEAPPLKKAAAKAPIKAKGKSDSVFDDEDEEEDEDEDEAPPLKKAAAKAPIKAKGKKDPRVEATSLLSEIHEGRGDEGLEEARDLLKTEFKVKKVSELKDRDVPLFVERLREHFDI